VELDEAHQTGQVAGIGGLLAVASVEFGHEVSGGIVLQLEQAGPATCPR